LKDGKTFSISLFFKYAPLLEDSKLQKTYNKPNFILYIVNEGKFNIKVRSTKIAFEA